MADSDLRKKIEDLGEGSFEQGIEQIYSSFVGVRRHLGIDTRFRTLYDSVDTLREKGLVSNIPEGIEFMNYLITQPTGYSLGNKEIKVLVREDSRKCRSGYTLSRVIKSGEYHD